MRDPKQLRPKVQLWNILSLAALVVLILLPIVTIAIEPAGERIKTRPSINLTIPHRPSPHFSEIRKLGEYAVNPTHSHAIPWQSEFWANSFHRSQATSAAGTNRTFLITFVCVTFLFALLGLMMMMRSFYRAVHRRPPSGCLLAV